MDQLFAEDRSLVENFAVHLSKQCGESHAIVVLLPWSSGDTAQEILAPAINGAVLDAASAARILDGKFGVLACCTFFSTAEERVARAIVQQLRGLISSDVPIMAVHVVPQESANYDRDAWDGILSRNQSMLDAGFDDVLLDPDPEPSQLRLELSVALTTWQEHERRKPQPAPVEDDPELASKVDALEKQHQKLLWEHIPNELMPHFAKLQTEMEETADIVGDYRLVRRRRCRKGDVWEAVREKDRTKVIIKVIAKAPIILPSTIECINRENRFLTGYTDHANIVKGLEMLHSNNNIYLVLEHAGDKNLAEYLTNLPFCRLDDKDAVLKIFWQIIVAVGHCHRKNISHRSIELEHIALKEEADGTLTAKLLDFHAAMMAKAGTTSQTMFSSLPYMSPEMLGGGPYRPELSDSWSLGVVLTETSGGLGSFLQGLNINIAQAEFFVGADPIDRKEAAQAILNGYASRGAIRESLSFNGALPRQDIVDILSVLLVAESERMFVLDLEQMKPS